MSGTLRTDALIGAELAGYRIESLVGRGGMGVVYLATDLRLKRRVALKLIAPDLAGDPRFRERFLRESELAASLDHSHVVPIYEAGEADGQLYIAMRYVEGTDLKSLLEQEGPLEPSRALELCSQVADALDAAHELGLVHRDVKPANVLVTREGGREHCYLSDFGLSHGVAAEHEPGETPHLSGTVDYTAPEQIARESADGRADVYSLACVLYECLAGGPPFERPRAIATLFAHVHEEPPPLSAKRAELPEGLDEVMAKALAKNPEDRYPTCLELVTAARAALGIEAAARLSRRVLLLAGGGAVAALAAAAVAAILLSQGGTSSVPPTQKPLLPLASDSLVRIDPRTNALAAAIPVASGPELVASGGGSVWVISNGDKTLSRVDPATNAVTRRIDLSKVGSAEVLAAGEGAIWFDAVAGSLRKLWRYEPRTRSLSPVNGTVNPGGLALGGGSVWVTDRGRSGAPVLRRIKPSTDQLVATIEVSCSCPLAFGNAAIWSVDGYWDNFATLRRIDPVTNTETEKIDLGFYPIAVAVGKEGIWLTDQNNDSVVQVDPVTKRVVQTIRVGRVPASLAVGEGFVWVANTRDETVSRIDPRTADVKTIDVGGTPYGLAVGAGGIWVAVEP